MAEDAVAHTRRKPVKLKEPITRDALRVWDLQNRAYFRQNNMGKFLPGGTAFAVDNGDGTFGPNDWTATVINERHGVRNVMRRDNHGVLIEPQEVDQRATQKEMDLFEDFLTILGTYCPDHFSDTVYMESTSYNWVLDRIKETFSLDQRTRFPAGLSYEVQVFPRLSNDTFTY